MGEIGYISLLFAFFVSVYSILAFAFGRTRSALRAASGSLLIVFGLVSVAMLMLLVAILSHNFRLEYVASYTSRETPFAYLVSALWAGSSGSLLLWAWLLALCAVIAFRNRRDNLELVPYAAAVTMFTQAFFLLLLMSVSNPFSTLDVSPADGRGMNPMLENPGMVVHPPALLAGYVLLTIPFAFAVAALMVGKFSEGWLAVTRRWSLAAWLLLGAGLIIGAWWAYVELGWGGYWAWDPVENAGLLPWLVVTAFLHSAMMQKRRGIFKVWNMLLLVSAFVLAVFGTFLTRSGIVSSVHTFAESGLGPFFTIFLSISVFVPLFLGYHRRAMLRSDNEIESLLSRESAALMNSLLFFGATLVVLLGTMYPALTEAFTGMKITLKASFFNQVVVPVFLGVVLLTGFCALVGWRETKPGEVLRRALLPLAAGVALGVMLFALGITEFQALFAIVVADMVLFAVAARWWREIADRHAGGKESYLDSFWNLLRTNTSRYGGYIVHIGIVLMTVGVVGSSVFAVETETALKTGASLDIGDYTLVFQDSATSRTPSRTVLTATVAVSRDGRQLGTLTPEKFLHRSYEQPVTEVAIRSNLREDLYVILLGQETDGSMAFKVLVNPLVVWIWIGGTVGMLGGLIAFLPQRREAPVPVRAATKPPPAGRPAAVVGDEIEAKVALRRKKKKRK